MFKYIHNNGYIYLDLKDENISILSNPIKIGKYIQNITIIDFGFCEKYDKYKPKWPKGYGNMYFSSINALKRMPVSFKDDIISLCYLLIYLYYGYLPWDNISNMNNYRIKCINMKEKFDADLFCGNEIKEIPIILNNVNKLNNIDLPNYNNYIKILKESIENRTTKNLDDILFDWEIKIIKLIKENNNIENLIKNKEIALLFEGYPEIYYKIYLKKYLKYI